MAQTNNFFYNPSFVDFIPGSPQVDLNFLKSVADDYKASVDKQDQLKDQLLSGLASLDLHQTFSKDYADMMKNVDTQLESLDQRYNGKLIDRNYGNELKSLVRNVQNDPNLRYMVNTTKELRTYEEQLRQSKDYLNFNDPNRSAYQAVLNRVKGSQPLFTAGTIYADAKPDKELYEIASNIGIKSGTRFEYVVDENGMGTGVVYTIDEQTRTRKDVTDKMKPYLETFRNTLGGQQLQREAAENGMSYEQLYLKKIEAMGPLLEIENMRAAVGPDPAWQAEMERLKIRTQQEEAEANRRFQAKENELNRNQQERLQEKQLQVQQKLADRDHIDRLMQLQLQWQQLGWNLELQYDQLNASMDKMDNEMAIRLAEKQVEAMKNWYTPGTGSSSGTGGGGSSNRGGSGTMQGYLPENLPNSLDASNRYTSTFAQVIDPGTRSYVAKKDYLASLDKNLAAEGQKLTNKYGNNITDLIHQLENANSKEREKILSTTIKSGGKVQKLSEVLNNDLAAYKYQQMYAEASSINSDMGAIDSKAAQSLFSAVENSSDLSGLVAAGVIRFEQAGNGLAERIVVDESRMYSFYGATKFIQDKKAEAFGIYVQVPSGAGGVSGIGANESKYFNLNSAEVYAAYSKGKGLNINGIEISPEKVIQLVNERDANIKDATRTKFPIIGVYLDKRQEEFEKYNGSFTPKGYQYNPDATDDFGKSDANYRSALQNSLPNLAEKMVGEKGETLTYKQDRGGIIVAKGTGSTGWSPTVFTQITPSGLYIDRHGNFVIQAVLREGKDDKGNYTGASKVVSIHETEDNINASVLQPLLYTQFKDENIANFVSARIHDNAKWVANSFISKGPNGDLTKTYNDGSTKVTKNVDGTYTVQLSDGKSKNVTSEFQLAILLSLVEYQSSVPSSGTPGMPDMDLPKLTSPRYGPSNLKIKTFDDLMRDYNELNRGLDKPDVYELETRTTTDQTKTITAKQTKDYIFDGPISNIESGGNYGAVNDKTPKGASRPTWAAGKYQFLPKWWDATINERAIEYYGREKGSNYHIYDKRADILGRRDIRGPQYNDFLKDAGFQEYVMEKAINDVYMPAYARLDPKLRDKINPSDYFIIAHYLGPNDAKKYFTDRITGSITLGADSEDAATKYLNKVRGSGTELGMVDYSEGMNLINDYEMKIDYKLRKLPPGSTLVLPDGTPYKKTAPKGVPNYEYTPPEGGVPKSGIGRGAEAAPPKPPVGNSSSNTQSQPSKSTVQSQPSKQPTQVQPNNMQLVREISDLLTTKQVDIISKGLDIAEKEIGALDTKAKKNILQEILGPVVTDIERLTDIDEITVDFIKDLVLREVRTQQEYHDISQNVTPQERAEAQQEVRRTREVTGTRKVQRVEQFVNETVSLYKDLQAQGIPLDPQVFLEQTQVADKYPEMFQDPVKVLKELYNSLADADVLTGDSFNKTYNNYVVVFQTWGLISEAQANKLKIR